MPNKTLNEVTEKTLLKKYFDSSFAKGCDRNRISLSDDLGLTVEDFLSLSLQALKEIAPSINL